MERLAATWTNPSEPLKDTELLRSLDSTKWRKSSGTLEEIPLAVDRTDVFNEEEPTLDSSESEHSTSDTVQDEALSIQDGILHDPANRSSLEETKSNGDVVELSGGPQVATEITREPVETTPSTETDVKTKPAVHKFVLEVPPGVAELNPPVDSISMLEEQEERDGGLAAASKSIPWWASRKRRRAP